MGSKIKKGDNEFKLSDLGSRKIETIEEFKKSRIQQSWTHGF